MKLSFFFFLSPFFPARHFYCNCGSPLSRVYRDVLTVPFSAETLRKKEKRNGTKVRDMDFYARSHLSSARIPEFGRILPRLLLFLNRSIKSCIAVERRGMHNIEIKPEPIMLLSKTYRNMVIGWKDRNSWNTHK